MLSCCSPFEADSPKSSPDLLGEVVEGIEGGVADKVVRVLFLDGCWVFERCGGGCGWGRGCSLFGRERGNGSLLVAVRRKSGGRTSQTKDDTKSNATRRDEGGKKGRGETRREKTYRTTNSQHSSSSCDDEEREKRGGCAEQL